MKKFAILGIVAISGWLLSCEEEEVADFVRRDYVTGTWTTKQIGVPGPYNNGNEVVTQITYQDIVNNPACGIDNLVINADGTYELNDWTNTGACENNGISGTYTRADNRIFLRYTDDLGEEKQLVVTISTLTYTEMLVSYTVPGTNNLRFFRYQKQTE
ncbi:hypothetical protein CHU92_02265 [Flavobacterium cyanobacteriorum]|uniref:Lipocalin-like domain-containing protein n=1 Tax=Flavobacterium cyanobacteriorum TaxID=2022802 RepID=A0A255ZVU6_9FLAO|nr:hypothetical protein [Flavobacterium cyanobacteriorum]OYQ44880.1 hypothetical protein CHU92_02265 [Flavobacterium cyanobacteriorum]